MELNSYKIDLLQKNKNETVAYLGFLGLKYNGIIDYFTVPER